MGLALLLWGILVMLPTVSGFFEFDDIELIEKNPLLDSWARIPEFFVNNMFLESGADALYRPLLMFDLLVERHLLGGSAAAFHLTSVLYHACAGLLFFAVLKSISGRSLWAWIAALLFAVHPVHVDVAAFAVNRSETFAFVFVLIAVYLYWKSGSARGLFPVFPDRPWGRISLWLSAFSVLLALTCKETAAPYLPWVLLLLALQPGGAAADRPAPWRSYVALLFGAYALYFAARIFAIGGLGGGANAASIPDRSLPVLLPTVSRIFLEYLRLLAWPTGLRVDYLNFPLSRGPWEFPAILSYLVHLLILSTAVFAFLKKRPWIAFAIGGFYLGLAPVAHLIPFRDVMAERFLYIGCAFYCALLASLILRLAPLFRLRSVVPALVIGAYSLVTVSHALNFRSRERLWTAMVETDPGHPKFQNNLGVVLSIKGRGEEAIPHLERALSLAPGVADPLLPLGKCYLRLGQTERAGKAFARAVQIAPLDSATHRNLAVFQHFRGHAEEALASARRALALDPEEPRNLRTLELVTPKR